MNKDTFATVSSDSVIRVWDLKSSKCVYRWNLNPENTKDVRLQQVGVVSILNGEALATLSLNGVLTILKLNQEEPLAVIKGHNKGITSLAVNPTVTGSFDGKIIDWKQPNPVMYQTHDNLIIGINNKQYPKVSSVSWDDTLQINDEIKYKFESQPKFAAVNLDQNDKDLLYAVINNNNELVIIQSFTGKITNKMKLQEQASCIAISKTYVTVRYERSDSIELFELNNFEKSFKLKSNMITTPSYIYISLSEKIFCH